MEKLKDRIKAVVNKVGGKRAMARAIEVSDTQVYRYINGINTPGMEVIKRIADVGGVSVEWLMNGEGRYDLGQLDLEEKLNIVSDLATRHEGTPNPEKLAMHVMDSDAMEPTLHNGEIFVYDTTQNDLTKSGEGIYTFVLDGRLMTRRLQLLPGGAIEIICDNPIYKNTTIQSGEVDFEIQGRARPTR